MTQRDESPTEAPLSFKEKKDRESCSEKAFVHLHVRRLRETCRLVSGVLVTVLFVNKTACWPEEQASEFGQRLRCASHTNVATWAAFRP